MAFDLATFKAMLATFAPLVLAFVPNGAKFAPFVPLLVNGISEAEAVHGTSGPEKKAAVLALVQTATAATNAAKPGAVDPVQAQQTASAVTDAVIGIINAVQHSQAAPSPVAPKPAA